MRQSGVMLCLLGIALMAAQPALCLNKLDLGARLNATGGLFSRFGRRLQQMPIPSSSQFDISGIIQAATLDTPANVFTGGTIMVADHLVIVPKNTIVILPANALTWAELFTQAPAPYTGKATGMALADSPAIFASYEAHVVGNRVGDKYIAGLIWISQNFLSTGAGYINHIDYATGEIRVGGPIGDKTQGARVRINDPKIQIGTIKTGRYSKGLSPDPRFQVDQDNPTIMAATGFPMCIPRDVNPANGVPYPLDAKLVPKDPLCPPDNRPLDDTGKYVTRYFMSDPSVQAFPDPKQQAPMMVGDYVFFAGTLAKDCPTCSTTHVSAHTITSNVAIFTQPGTSPAYVMMDVSIIGTGGQIIPGLAEAAFKEKFEGMTTDPSRNIHLYALDFDPATGAVSDRDFGTIGVDPGPPVGAVLGRWRYASPCNAANTNFKLCTPPLAGTFLPPPREVRAVIEGEWKVGQTTTYANGLLAGQYHAPIAEYIFPENIPGTPMPENNFNFLNFLAYGGYSSTSGVFTTGPLVPWPSSTPAGQICIPPTANAGGTYTVALGSTITLDGTASKGSSLTYSWTWTFGKPHVGTLALTNTGKPTYTAPTSGSGGTIVFVTMTVTNACGTQTNDASITIATPKQPTVTHVTPMALVSGEFKSITLSGTDPNVPSLALTFGASQSGAAALLDSPSGSTNLQPKLVNSNSATLSFTAPVLPIGSVSPVTITLNTWATNSAGMKSGTDSTTVTVFPSADVLTVAPGAVLYRSSIFRLDFTLTSSVRSPAVTVTLMPYQTLNGLWDPVKTFGALANFVNNGLGGYTLQLVGAPMPTGTVQAQSSLGGKTNPVFPTLRVK